MRYSNWGRMEQVTPSLPVQCHDLLINTRRAVARGSAQHLLRPTAQQGEMLEARPRFESAKLKLVQMCSFPWENGSHLIGPSDDAGPAEESHIACQTFGFAASQSKRNGDCRRSCLLASGLVIKKAYLELWSSLVKALRVLTWWILFFAERPLGALNCSHSSLTGVLISL